MNEHSAQTVADQQRQTLRLFLRSDAEGSSRIWELVEESFCGRSGDADIHLDDPRVSRHHADFLPTDSGWLISDRSSHGTFVNGIQLKPGEPMPICSGDRIGIGPYQFAVGSVERNGSKTGTVSLREDIGTSRSSIELADRHVDVRAMSAEILRTLFETAGALRTSPDLQTLATNLIRSLVDLTGYEWAAVLQYDHGDSGTRSIIADLHRPANSLVSASLLRAAREGTASLSAQPDLMAAQSIVASATADAIASTVRVGSDPVWQVYLASRKPSFPSKVDAAVVMDAMARIAGLVLSDRQREDLAVRQTQFQRDIQFAREVQGRLLGKVCEESGSGLHTMVSIPGRGVAGDLVGYRTSPCGHRYFFIGDVSGKGAAAAMLMAATQAYIASLIDQSIGLADLVDRLNRYLCSVSAANEFVTLWIGCSDASSGRVVYIDAGHGYAFLCDPDRRIRQLREGGGPPMGIDIDSRYAEADTDAPEGSILLLCSDGLVEQQSPSGDEFGSHAISETLRSTDLSELEAKLIDDLSRHASDTHYADDVTFAIIRT